MDLTLLALVASQVATALQGLRYASEIGRQQDQIGGLLKEIEVNAVAPLVYVPRRRLFEEIVGSSEVLDKVLSQTERVAPSNLPVLIAGETGTGKELLARALHRLSPRADQSFVCVNCPAIPQELAESHLFGHCRGAFTGATEARDGAFEVADGGTIFLDEVGDLPLAVQVKLLRVLQEGEVQRLGSRSTRTVDVRIVSATNRDLREDVRLGRFRDDLYHRLAGMRLELPPLRARVADIRPLATLFFERAVQRHQRPIRGISVGGMELLCHYPWPGNIRELQNVVERAVLLSPDELIDQAQIAELLAENSGSKIPLVSPTPSSSASLSGALREEKLRMVATALSQVGGNQAAAARLLGMSRSNLSRLLKRYGLRTDESDR